MPEFLLHPPISAFPIAFLYLLGALELFFLVRRSNGHQGTLEVVVVFTLLATAAAYFTGDTNAQQLKGVPVMPEGSIAFHHVFGKATFIALVPLVLLKVLSNRATHARTLIRTLYLFHLLVCLTLATTTGYLGGELVFRYAVGVRVD